MVSHCKRPSSFGLVAFAVIAVAGCGEELDDIEVVTSELLNHPSSRASEITTTDAVTTTDGHHVLVATYNEEDPSLITYSPANTRQIFRTASQMGFFWLDIEGDSGLSGRLRPPSGWSVLWGDPSITRNRANANRVYMANLAIPDSKYPSPGPIQGAVNPSTLPTNYCGAYLGGGCVARSSDGGRTFSLSASDCLRRTSMECPNGTFYDGSTMETSPEGRVYVAFEDVKRRRSDVYMATSSTGSFQRITDSTLSSWSHPRLKWGPGGLYMLVQGTSSTNASLAITRYGGGSSFSGSWTTPTTILSTGLSRDTVNLGDRTIRLGPQYDLAIGKNLSGVDVVRVVYTTLDSSGKHRVRVAECTTTSTITCTFPSSWRTDGLGGGAGEQWMPAITTGTSASAVSYFLISFFSTHRTAGTNQVELWDARVGNSFTTNFAHGPQRPCPTTGDGHGYWGDYDNMSSGSGGMIFRGFSNSFNGCTSQGLYNAAPVWASIFSRTVP
jgi:hypothetical protein